MGKRFRAQRSGSGLVQGSGFGVLCLKLGSALRVEVSFSSLPLAGLAQKL